MFGEGAIKESQKKISIYKEMKSNMARNASFLIPRTTSKDSEDFKKIKFKINK